MALFGLTNWQWFWIFVIFIGIIWWQYFRKKKK